MSLTCTDHLNDGLLRVPEATPLLGLSRSKVYQLMDRGELTYARFGNSRRSSQVMPNGQN